MVDTHRKLVIFTALVLGAFVLKAPVAITQAHVTPDAVVYLNIARNLASGNGCVSTLRLHYVNGAEVAHSTSSECPPLYPLAAAGILRCGGGPAALALANTMLACLASGLVFLIGTSLFDSRTGAIAGAAAAIAPNLFRTGITAMSDPLALVLALSAILLVLREKAPTANWLAAGMLAGLAALTRYPCAVVGLSLVIAALRTRQIRQSIHRADGLACAIGLLPSLVYIVLAAPSVQGLHYQVESFHSAMWNLGSPIDPLYALHHAAFVAKAFLHNVEFYLIDLFTGFRGLFLLSLGLPMWLLRAKPTPLGRGHKLALVIAVLTVVVYSAAWSIPPVKGSRFLVLPYCLLLPFCAAGVAHARGRWNRYGRLAIVVCCGIVAGTYVWGCATAASYTGGDIKPLPNAQARLIEAALPKGAAVASNNPWVISHSTAMPTALLPRNLGQDKLVSFIGRYHIQGIVLLGKCEGSRTASTVRASYPATQCGPDIQAFRVRARTRTKAD